jgi:hypothetical protein
VHIVYKINTIQLVSYEVLGKVVNTIRFNSLVDFQFVIPKDKHADLSQTKVEDAVHIFGEQLNMPPPFFTRVDKPLTYWYLILFQNNN